MRQESAISNLRWLVSTCTLLMVLTGCVATDDAEQGGGQTEEGGSHGDDSSSADEPLGSSSGTSTDGGADLVFEITGLGPTSDESLLLEFSVQNNSNDTLPFQTALSGTETSATPNAVTLIDPSNAQRYFPQELADGSCFCANWDDQPNLRPGDSLDIWIVYPELQADTDNMIVDIPQSPPIIDIPIGSETTPPDQPSGDLAEPKVLDLYNFADNLDDGTSRSESEEETAIMLSTDVLFETGESALSEDAEGVLEEAGIEIDDASGELIQIEGHADDTGSDAVNDPLSLDRAEAVRDHLEAIVTRSDVVFEAEGFGSTDPIADNESEDGREKNRRVTVTFAK